MTNIDNIWKQFGDSMKDITINYEPDSGMWRVTFKFLDDIHTETDPDMTAAAERMLTWFRNIHTHKYAAESMFSILERIENITNRMPATVYNDAKEIEKLCRQRNEFIERSGENMVWKKEYDAVPESAPKKTQDVKKPKTGKPVEESVPKGPAPQDGYPPYFTIDKGPLLECWGYDVNGDRTHVTLDHLNQSRCAIDAKFPPGVQSDDSSIVEISESEYNEYYDIVSHTIAAWSMGYGIDDFTKYQVKLD